MNNYQLSTNNYQLPEGYKQTEVGVIPEDWLVLPLSSVASLDVGYAFKSSWYQKDNGIPLLRGENVGYGRLDWTDLRSLPEDKAKPFSAYRLCPNDIVIGMDRTFTKSGTKISLLQGKDCPCLLVQRVGRFVPLKCSHSFLWALLSSPKFQLSLQLQQKGMDIPHLSRTEILQPYVALPPTKAEQEAIAQALSDVDRLIGALDKLSAKKRRLKTATMQQLLTGKKRLPGFGEGKGYKKSAIGVIPEGWEPCKVGDVISFSGGSQPPRNTFIFKPRIGYLRLIQIRDYKTDAYATYIPEELAKKKCAKDDVMIGRYGPPIFQILRGIEGAYNVALIKAIPSEKIDKEFLYHFIKNEELFKLMEMLSQRSSGQTGVELPALREYPLALPSAEEQRAIAAVLSDMDAEIAALETRLAKTQSIKQGMMQALLTGRVRLV